MAENLESFVAKLQAEGVQAGRREAAKLRAEAEAQAKEIITKAQAEAETILNEAKAQAQSERDRAETELKLASRDAVLRLRDGLNKAIRAVLAEGTKDALGDGEFLCKTIHELVMLYAKADLEGGSAITVNVSPETYKKLADWALHEIADKALKECGGMVNMAHGLRQEGFELQISGSTVEVTLESVVDTLGELVSPRLREVLGEALGEETE